MDSYLQRTEPRKPLYWTHHLALRDATIIAHTTGIRQRVESVPGPRVLRWRIVEVKP